MYYKKAAERGATLIVILILLLLVTIIGTFAVRQSMTSLNIATNSQAQQLMFQNAQSYLLKLTSSQVDQQKINASVFGMIGFATQTENIGHEVAYCYSESMTGLFDVSRVAVNDNTTAGTDAGTNLVKTKTRPLNGTGSTGFCDPEGGTKADNYSSARDAVMTQVYVKAKQKSSDIFSNFNEGTDHPSVSTPVIPVRIHVISVVPGLSNNNISQIKICFSNFPAEQIDSIVTGTVTQCLKKYNIPFSSQVADYQQQNDLS